MRIHVHYWNQIRAARGVSEEVIDCDDQATLMDLLQRVGEQDAVRQLLFDDDGNLSKWILVDRAGEMVRDASLALSDGDEIRLMTHISGG